VGLEVPAWAPRPGRGNPPLSLGNKAVQSVTPRSWPDMGRQPTRPFERAAAR